MKGEFGQKESCCKSDALGVWVLQNCCMRHMCNSLGLGAGLGNIAGNANALHLAIECGAVDFQHTRSFRLVATSTFQNFDYFFFFTYVWRKCCNCCTGRRRSKGIILYWYDIGISYFLGKMLHRNRRTFAENAGSFYNMSQFPNIARP